MQSQLFQYYFLFLIIFEKQFLFSKLNRTNVLEKKLRLHIQTCTDFVLLLIEIFGTSPGKEDLTGVAIDRACDVHPYLTRIGNEGSQVVFSLFVFEQNKNVFHRFVNFTQRT